MIQSIAESPDEGTSRGMLSAANSAAGARTGLERTPVKLANRNRENIAKGANLP